MSAMVEVLSMKGRADNSAAHFSNFPKILAIFAYLC